MSDFDPLQLDERLGAAHRGAPNPVLLSRQLARADAEYRAWHERLRDDPECEEDPLAAHRAVAGRTLFRDLDQLGEHDPLRVYLRRWVLCSSERRINAAVLKRFHHELHHQPVSLPQQATPLPLATLLLDALRQPAAAPFRLQQYLDNSHSVAQRVAALWERRGELWRRWDVGDWEPTSAVEPGAPAPLSVVEQARAWLDRTQDMAQEYREGSLASWIEQGLARDAKLDWPGRLSWRTFGEWFGDGDLLLSLRLSSKRLPERIAPASFLRGLERLGQQWSEALAPTDQFFVVAHDPFRLRTHVHGALFAGLLVNASFLQRRLAAEPVQLRAALRPLFRALLLESRSRALKVVVAAAGRRGRSAFRETFMVETAHRLGFELPAAAAGALLSPGTDCAPAFEAMMLATVHAEQLASSHDEDWFRNPRAIDQLRSEASLPPPLTLDADAFNRGAAALYATLAKALG